MINCVYRKLNHHRWRISRMRQRLRVADAVMHASIRVDEAQEAGVPGVGSAEVVEPHGTG